jgi:hypothetical protein
MARKRPGYARHLWKFELLTLPETSATTTVTPVPSDDDPVPPRYLLPYPEIENQVPYIIQNVGNGKAFVFAGSGTRGSFISLSITLMKVT